MLDLSSSALVQGELQVSLIEARALPVWGFPWTSNPWCRLTLGNQVHTTPFVCHDMACALHLLPSWYAVSTSVALDRQDTQMGRL